MRYIILVLSIIVLHNTAYSQQYYLGIEAGYGISSSNIEIDWSGSTITPLADNCGRAGFTGKLIFDNNFGLSSGLNYLLLQLPEKMQNTGVNLGPAFNQILYLKSRHHYLNIPILLSYTIDYFRMESGFYYSLLLAQNADAYARKSDVGFKLKLNFNIYKGFYFYQETSFGLINMVNVENMSKKNYYVMLGLGYNLKFEN
jgi:hypothetical protein